MIGRLAVRSLLLHPVRTAVLAGGFGLGIAVMANLLGVAGVVLEQSQSPALVGGGDVVLTGAAGPLTSARYLLWGALGAPAFAGRVAVASPTRRDSLYLVQDGVATRLRARAGIPSLERALNDPETASSAAWQDTPADAAWTSPDPGDVLRSLDRFHPIPDVPARAGSWTEWLYFNGQAGATRFYLTFLVGPLRRERPAHGGRAPPARSRRSGLDLRRGGGRRSGGGAGHGPGADDRAAAACEWTAIATSCRSTCAATVRPAPGGPEREARRHPARSC